MHARAAVLYSAITPIGHCRGVALITRHVSLNSKVYSAPSFLALLLLVWSGAAIGATALETRCDQSVRASDMPDTRPVSFSIDTSETDEVDEMAAPMAADQGDTVEEAASKSESEEPSETSARLPGVSEDDLNRFKRRMYRKDI